MDRIMVLMLGEAEELGWIELSHVGDALLLTNDAGEIKFASLNVETILGYTRAEVMELGHIGAVLGIERLDRTELEAWGKIRHIEHVMLSKSGEERYLEIDVKAVWINECTLLYTCRNVTETRNAEQELSDLRSAYTHASRLALAGHLMATIVHEVIQPLTSIVTDADAALVALESAGSTGITAEVPDILKDIHAEGQRMARILLQLRELVHRQPLNRQPLDLGESIEDALRLVRSEMRCRRVSLRTELGSSLNIEADPCSLQQIVLNIVTNALDAMDDVDDRQRTLEVRTCHANGSIEITVADNGPGISTNDVARIFDAFFTTKAEGLGLGLTIAKTIVEEHGGSISAEAGPGTGATIRVRLPYHERATGLTATRPTAH